MKNKSVSRSRNWCLRRQIQSGIFACVMSRYFTRTSLYLVRLKIIKWIKFLRRHLRKIQENGAGRNFITHLAYEFTAHYACKSAEINLKSTTSNGFNFWKINSLMDSWGVRLTWLDCTMTVRERNNLIDKNIIVLYLQIYNTQNFIPSKMLASGSFLKYS